MVVLLATSGIVSQTPVAFVFAEDGDSGEEVTEAEIAAEEVTEAETTAEEVTEAETTAEEVTEAKTAAER